MSNTWKQLEQHCQQLQSKKLSTLAGQSTLKQRQTAGLTIDFSKNFVDATTLKLFSQRLDELNMREWIEKQFTGAKINNTEDRAVLHTALRDFSDTMIEVDGQNIKPEIKQVHERMAALVDKIHSSDVTDVVHIGIGGSDLGPRMVCRALAPYHLKQVTLHFVSNVDGTAISETLKRLNAKTTLFIIASKSFTTQETLLNATTAKSWLTKQGVDNHAEHLIAITSRVDRAQKFGIDAQHCLPMWDWVGGRYSLWSAIGLPIVLAVGMKHFEALLKGAYEMDQHFRGADWQDNLPVLMACIAASYNNFYGAQSHAIIPYDLSLELLPAYLQQAVMESNGKSVTRDGKSVSTSTSPIIWGGVGTDTQHSFHQLLHQGTPFVPVDFILPEIPHHDLPEHHRVLKAHCHAQAQALMEGNSDVDTPYKMIPGNKPSTLITMKKLTPETLGALIALYEHRIFVESILWNINAYDQWGVELGKALAAKILLNLT